MKSRLANMVTAAMAASVICISTLFLQIPSPFRGYLHMGDSVILLIGWLLPTHYAILAAGIGAALADFLSGYALYVPATFVIKAIMVYAICAVKKRLPKRFGKKSARLLGGIAAEILMILGYWIYESLVYGFSLATLNFPGNLLQAGLGLVSAMILSQLLRVGIETKAP